MVQHHSPSRPPHQEQQQHAHYSPLPPSLFPQQPAHSLYQPIAQRPQHMQAMDDGQSRSTTYVPSLIPPGVDPAHVDMRTFYPYTPNEVKHRKRTTRHQLRVLEEVYKTDTKPNASLRKKLADQLSMTPRGVQVWFQNRRAKTKTLAKRAEQGVRKKEDPEATSPTSGASPSESESPVSFPLVTDVDGTFSETDTAIPDSISPTTDNGEILSIHHDLVAKSEETQAGDEWLKALQTPLPPDDGFLTGPLLNATDIANLARRPSLPIIISPPSLADSGRSMSYSEMPMSFHEEEADLVGRPIGIVRRRSVETNLARLGAHPYAMLAPPVPTFGGSDRLSPRVFRHGSMPNAFCMSSMSHDMSEGSTHGDSLRPLPPNHWPPGARAPSRRLAPRLSVPALHFHNPNPFQSSPSPLQQQPFLDSSPISPHDQVPRSPSVTSPPRITRGLPLYAMNAPTRALPVLPPGPLPAPNFSFGSAPTQFPSPSATSPPLGTYRHEIEDGEQDAEDDASASSYDPRSRFGSLASVAGSETSWTSVSAYASDGGHCGSVDMSADLRRDSIGSGVILDMFGCLDVTGGSTPQADISPNSTNDQLPSTPHRSPGIDGSDHDGSDGQDNLLDPGSHSPSSTISASSRGRAETVGMNVGAISPSVTQQNGDHFGLADKTIPGDQFSTGGSSHADSDAYYAGPGQEGQSPVVYEYGAYAGIPIPHTNAVDLGNMCVPSYMMLENPNSANPYLHF